LDSVLQALQEVRRLREQEEQKQLYKKLNTAILEEQYSSMRDILQEPGYAPDGVGGEDERSALHVSAQLEDMEALDILLQQDNVDCNVPDSEGLTPAMLAAKLIKIDSLVKLLEDPRVKVKARTQRKENCYDLLPVHALASERQRVKTAFEAAKNRTSEAAKKRNSKASRVAIIIANSDYVPGYDSLPGVKEDLERLTAFLKKSYHIIIIENAEDIEAKVREEMEGLPASWLPVTHFQLVYLGNSA
jgi:hypothetical protein